MLRFHPSCFLHNVDFLHCLQGCKQQKKEPESFVVDVTSFYRRTCYTDVFCHSTLPYQVKTLSQKLRQQRVTMANAIPAQTTPQTTAKYEAEFETLMQEAMRLNALMAQDRVGIERLKAETREIRDETRALLTSIGAKL
jgi:hypothetical protein